MYSERRPWEYNTCKCGKKKQKKSEKCKTCSNKERHGETGIDKNKCLYCGGEKNRESKQCKKCLEISRWKKTMNRTLDETMHHNSASRAVYNAVRKYARKYLELKGIKKECVVCGYSKDILDTSHFRDIASFSLDTKIQEVNSLRNIMYLCPRCHKELDKEIMEKEDLEKISSYLNNQKHEVF